MTLFISIGYSAFSSKLLIGDTIANVRANADMRITGLNIESVNNATSNYEEYNVSNISVGVKLPSSTSTATYKLTVTNLGNVEMGIYEITNLPSNLDYELIDYTLQDKICDTSGNCSLGITKEFYIKIKYATNGYNSSSTTYDLNLGFDFRQIYTITYEEITNNNYPASVIQGGNVNITFTDPVPNNLVVSINGTDLSGDEYTYSNNILTINNVTGNVIIRESIPYICKSATTLHTETCSLTSTSSYCSGAGYANGSTITYGNLTNITLTSGDAFDCDVNGDGNYDPETERFYYVSDLSSNSNYAVLIYYNDTALGVADNTSASLIAYDSSGDNWYGPRTARANLPTVEQWSNVSLSSTTRAITTQTGTTSTTGGTLPTAFSYSGYAARLLTAQEVNAACGIKVGSRTKGELKKCEFLMENTYYSGLGNTLGYYLETPSSQHPGIVWTVDSMSRAISYANAEQGNVHDVRPVIEVLKSDILVANAISFTFDTILYFVPEGMTWGEFATSSYNTSEFGENIMDYPIYNTSSGTRVSSTDKIQANTTYKYIMNTFYITYVDNDGDEYYDEFYAPEGMTWEEWFISSYNTTGVAYYDIDSYYYIYDEIDGENESLYSTMMIFMSIVLNQLINGMTDIIVKMKVAIGQMKEKAKTTMNIVNIQKYKLYKYLK